MEKGNKKLIFFPKYYSFDWHGDVINPKLVQKRAETCFSCTDSDRKIKVNNNGKFEVKYFVLKPTTKILKFSFSVVTSLTRKRVKKI